MKNKIVIAFAAVLVFALAAVVFAYNNASNQQRQTADSKTHCEMMKSHHASGADAEHKDSCCGANADCCKDGKCCKEKDACPMKQKDARQPQTASVDLTNVAVVGDGENCCSSGSDCCKGGACCKKKS